MNKNLMITYMRCGLLGGLVGTVLMDLVMFVEFCVVHQPVTTNYKVIGAAVGSGTWVGFILHFIVGSGLGLLFGFFISLHSSMHIHTVKKGLILGILAGIVTIPFGCVPTALLSGVPILKLVGFSTLPHLVWGAGLGWITAHGVKRKDGSEKREDP